MSRSTWRAYPELVSGTEGADTRLIRAVPGLLSKGGAGGVPSPVRCWTRTRSRRSSAAAGGWVRCVPSGNALFSSTDTAS
ncbi:asparaginase [Planosporangium flavigriseum]|uniref:asparaginase n=1 Tax=Planosporangium flavigriseum TaxID=373681 RepID=UPI0031DD9DDC